MNIPAIRTRAAAVPLIVALVTGFVTTSTSASADVPGRVVVSDTSDSNSNDKGAEISCPDAKRVIGTGAEIIGDVAGGVGGDVVIDEVIPTGTSVSAYGVETLSGTSSPWRIRVWAVCGYPHGATTVRYATTSSHPNPKDVELDCRDGEWLLGSGYQMEGARGNVSVTDLIPTLDSVSVHTTENHRGYDGNYYLRAFAICAEERPVGLQVVQDETDENSSNKGTLVSCPEGKQALGAGFSIPGAAGETALTEFVPTTRAVTATANELSSTSREWSVIAYATCATE
ncbi:hypothetical protein FDA94_02210 [Herbidospora galbida]|uniref:Septum formation-related domain-containing protein n=1 Tax=Herbidospora galbida TaxID=2575442 RepID=A0A4U3MPQ3_9ACTN|nr:hypothetical protein [Herbidospora galbida]TKK91611.1 hypothetical protein FDA94_02210 [Herbidospora galbida]